MSSTYSVYVQTDENNNIIAPPSSSAFLSDTTGWTKIDEGNGDRYHLAESNYFDKHFRTPAGAFRYKLFDGKAVEKTAKEIATEEAVLAAKLERLAQIAILKTQLSASDYKVTKCAECSLAGLPLPYDIAALSAERQAIRDKINGLEVTNQ